jgi:O-antigen/teichoic acid export membrane protein
MLKNIKELGKDSFIYGLGSSLSQLIALFLIPLYSRTFEPNEYGVLALSSLMIQFSNPVLSLGLDNALFRYFAMSNNENERKSYVTTALIIKNIAVLLFIILFYFSYPLLNTFLFSGLLKLEIFILLLISLFLFSIGNIAEVLIRVQRKPKTLIAIQIPSTILGVLFSIYWVLILHWGMWGALAASLLSQLFSAIFYSFYIKKYFRADSFSILIGRQMLQYSLPYVPHRIQAQTMQWFSLFIVSQHMGITVAGIYSMINKFVKPINLIVDSIQKAWVPYKFQIHKSKQNPSEVFRIIICNYWLFILLLWCGASLIFPTIFKLLISSNYHDGIYYFPFLAIIPLAQVLNYTLTVGIELKESQKILPIGSFYGLVVVIAGSLLTINIWSPYGPILFQALSFCTSAIVIYRHSRKVMPINFPFKNFVCILIIEIGLILILYLKNGLIFQFIFLILFILLIFIVIKTFNVINPNFIKKYYKKFTYFRLPTIL